MSARRVKSFLVRPYRLTVGLAVFGVLLSASAEGFFPESSANLSDVLPREITSCAFPAAQHVDADRHSVYVPVADGTRLAVDIYLPKGAKHATKVPALYTATRYWRSSRDAPLNDNQKQWIASGFALVTLDVRGTGASFGQWYIPYSPQEAKDVVFIAQWIAKQSWSNGKVVMTGGSYTGTTPLLALSDGSSVIKAIAPQFADFDMYTDLLWPGGVTADYLIGKWGRAVRELDRNEPGGLGRESRDSVRPVDGPDGDKLLAAAISEHELNPWSFDGAINEVTFSDESLKPAHGLTINDGSAYSHREQIEHSGAPMFGWGSWLDSGIAQGMLNRFMTFSNPQLSIIGAWSHGARANANPFNLDAPLDPSPAMRNQIIYCYLSHYASTDRSPSNDRTIVYFTMGENRWKKTSVWPLAGTYQLRYYLDSGRELSIREPQTSGRDSYKVDFEADVGPNNRWATQAGNARIDYGDRSQADRRLLVYTSGPLAENLEVTGQPVVTLRASSTQADGLFFVYLEDVAPDGKVTYVTEGQLRALHRKLSDETPPYRTTYPYRTFAQRDAAPLVPGQIATLTFQLQATSVRFKTGHRLRLAIAGADKGTFMRLTAAKEGDVTLKVSWGGEAASFVDLPVIPTQ
jgi:uncharacterized protein